MPTLDFKGKSTVYSHHLRVPFRDLRINIAKSLPKRGGAPSLDDNLIIHGDNLHALKSLLPCYAGKIKCIYIDPPYNTGNEGWKYNDNVESPLMREWLGKEIGIDDLERHDKWLCMMWPRVQILKELLSEDGVILVSIDDNEVHNFRSLMDEIFNEENYLTTYYIQVRYPEKTLTEKSDYQKVIEQVLVYKKSTFLPRKEIGEYPFDKFHWKITERSKGKKLKIKGKEVLLFRDGEYGIEKIPASKDGLKETWATGTVARNNASGKFFAEYLKPRKSIDGLKCLYKVMGIGEDGLGHRYFTGPKKESASEGKFYSGVPSRVKKDIGIDGTAVKMKSIGNFYNFSDSFGNCRHEGGIGFTSGKKPIDFLKKILSHCTDKNDIVLDSFAGSGSTAHAIIDMNEIDNGNHKFILIECEDYAETITAERVRRVIRDASKKSKEKLKKESDISFTYCTLGNEINTESFLKGKGLPSYHTLAEYIFYTATGKTLETKSMKEEHPWFIGKTEHYIFYLVYKPSVDFLRSKGSALNLELAEEIKMIQRDSKKIILVYASSKYFDQKELKDKYNIQFCQLPYSIHRLARD